MQRVSVVGVSGSGKTTFATLLAERLGVPHLELDGVYHQPGWTHLQPDEFRAAIGPVLAQRAWVIDGNYSEVQPLVWERADTVIWLDLSKRVVMRRTISRSLRRVLGRRELWNGNREQLRNLLSRDPEESIVVWAWTRHGPTREKYSAKLEDEANDHLTFHRLRTPAAVNAFLDVVVPAAAAGARSTGTPDDT